MWFPLVACVLLYAVVGLVLWAVWEPFAAEIKENPVINVPTIGIMLAVVLLPPLAWAIALAT